MKPKINSISLKKRINSILTIQINLVCPLLTRFLQLHEVWPPYPEPRLRLEFHLGRVPTDSARNDVEDARSLSQSDIDFAYLCKSLRQED